MLPEDAHLRLAQGRVSICLCDPKGPFTTVFVEAFGSKGEVVDALVASCFIPGFMAMAPVDPVHGAVDAAFALDMDDHRRAAEMLVVSKPIGFMYSHLLFNLAAVDEAEAMGLFEQGRTAAHAHDREAWAQQLASSREGAG